jgi:hypothetical protein
MSELPSATSYDAPAYTPRERLENRINTLTYRGRTGPLGEQDAIKREILQLQAQYQRLTGNSYTPPHIEEH